MVAPLVGAWIEINVHDVRVGISCLSLLSWERGLKYHIAVADLERIVVAPLVGAWIEIPLLPLVHLSALRRSSRGSVD